MLAIIVILKLDDMEYSAWSFVLQVKTFFMAAQLICFSDSDWAGDSTRHTTACGIICIAGAPVAWTVRLLKNMALSSFEGELTFSETGKLGTYVLNLLNQIGIGSNVERPTRRQ